MNSLYFSIWVVMMKKIYIVCTFLISSMASADTFYNVDEVRSDYLERVLNEEPDRRVPLKMEKVKHQEKDFNGDGKLDLAVFDYYHCGSTGCRGDIYLCNSGSEECAIVGYCFAGRVIEGDLVQKSKELMCK